MKKLIIAAATAFTLALTAQAQDKATLDLLVKKGIITQTEADELIKAKAATPAPAPVIGKFGDIDKITVGGILQGRYSLISVNEKKGAPDPADANGFMARRVIVPIGAKMGDFSVLLLPTFDTTRNGAAQAGLNMAFLTHTSEYGAASFGLKKVSFGLEEYLSPPAIDNPVVEYSGATAALASPFASRHLGIFWDGAVKDTGFRYGAALTNSATDLWNTGGAAPAATVNASNNELAYWANVAYDIVPEKGSKITFGLNTGWVGEGGVNNDYIFGYNPFVNVGLGKLTLMGEILGWITNGTNGASDMNSWGYNLTAAYKVTESIEPVVRFSQYKGDGRRQTSQTLVFGAPRASSSYDDAYSVYAGFNWYITPRSVKLQTGYEFSQLTDAANRLSQVDAHAFRTQLQVVF